jgi:DNA-binding LacI/PurR family transcriptional regulator
VKPDAVFAFSDLLALGALRACHDRGYRVPEDIAIVGFDDIEDGRYSVPSLSTVSPDKGQIARLAVDLLVSRLDHGHGQEDGQDRGADAVGANGWHETRECVARHQLIVRESSAGAAASVPLWAR